MDAHKANIGEKENLVEYLRLCWASGNASESGIEIEDENVLEAFEPHPNLETIYFPFWMSNPTLQRIDTIKISYCEHCVRLPQLGELPLLESCF